MSFVQGVQACRMCRHGRASFFFFSLFLSFSLSFFSKKKGPHACKPANLHVFGRFPSVAPREGKASVSCTLPAQIAAPESWSRPEVVQVRRSPVKTEHLPGAIRALSVQNAHGVQRWLHAAQRIH